MIIVIVLLVVVVFSSVKIIDSFFLTKSVDTDTVPVSKTVTLDGVEYYPRQDITTFMLLGIDQKGPVEESTSYNNEGEADMIALAVFDEIEKTYNLLLLNRDTMTDIPILGIGGKPAGVAYQQLALAHTYGRGLEDSCENTRDAVSDLLNGIIVDHYLSMNMDAIGILTDAVGGVKVTVTDDFSEVEPSISMGEITLSGEQAISFVQTRKDVGNQMNISRIDRHKEFMNGFLEALKSSVDGSDSFVIKNYDSISDYVVTDSSVNTLNKLFNRYVEYELEEIVSPEGENKKGETYMEFYPDKKLLDEMVIDLFYAEK
jgi:LCP family protein required for cell wall assembly